MKSEQFINFGTSYLSKSAKIQKRLQALAGPQNKNLKKCFVPRIIFHQYLAQQVKILKKLWPPGCLLMIWAKWSN